MMLADLDILYVLDGIRENCFENSLAISRDICLVRGTYGQFNTDYIGYQGQDSRCLRYQYTG